MCGPAGEQSAQSHSITLTQALGCFPITIPGTLEAFAVEGSPADSVMLALNSSVFQVCSIALSALFDLQNAELV